MKKLIVGCLIFFCVAIASLWFIDVNRYLPYWVDAANQKIQGKLELGRGSLSLWKGAHVAVEGLKLSDTKGEPIIVVKKAFFKVSWVSLVMQALGLQKKGSVLVRFQVEGAEIYLKKKRKVWNFSSLLPPATSSEPSSQAKGSSKLAWRLNLDFLDSTIHYEDEAMKTQARGIELHLEDVSLTHPSRFSLVATVEKRDALFQVSGKTEIKAQVFPEMDKNQLKWEAQVDFGGLEAIFPGKFLKKKGVPASCEMSGALHWGSEVRVDLGEVRMALLQSTWKGYGFAVFGEELAFAAQVKSDPIEVAPWAEVLPLLKEYQPKGRLRLEGRIKRQKALAFEGKLFLEAFSVVLPRLKAPLISEGVVEIQNERVQTSMSLQTSGNQVKVAGTLVSFTHPSLEVKVSGSEWDADILSQASSGNAPASGVQSSEVTADASWKKNPLLLKSRTRWVMDVGGIRAQGVKLAGIHSILETQGLQWTIPQCSFRVFSGGVKMGGSGHADLKPYHMKMQVDGLNIKEALTWASLSWANTMAGKAEASVDVQGEGSSLASWKGQGSMKIRDVVFSGLDLGKIALESVEKSMQPLTKKVPGIQEKVLNFSQKQSRYNLVSADFKVAGGFFEMSSWMAQARAQEGIDLRGQAKIGLSDKSLEGTWEMIDTYGMTHLEDLSLVQQGVRVDRILAEKNAPVRLPMRLGGKLNAPRFFYEQTSDHLIRVALSNVAQALKGQAGKKLKEQVAPLLKDAPPAIQEQLKKWFR